MTRAYIRLKPVNNWTPEKIEAAANLWRDGWQGWRVAEAVGGVSAVQVQRMMRKLSVTQGEMERQKPPRPKKRITPPKLTVINNTEPLAIGPLNDFSEHGTCRWIHGDPARGEWQCCGFAVKVGTPYCDHHHARCIVKSRPISDKEMVFRPMNMRFRGAV